MCPKCQHMEENIEGEVLIWGHVLSGRRAQPCPHSILLSGLCVWSFRSGSQGSEANSPITLQEHDMVSSLWLKEDC